MTFGRGRRPRIGQDAEAVRVGHCAGFVVGVWLHGAVLDVNDAFVVVLVSRIRLRFRLRLFLLFLLLSFLSFLLYLLLLLWTGIQPNETQLQHTPTHKIHYRYANSCCSVLCYRRLVILTRPNWVVSANTTDTFKARLDKFWHNQDNDFRAQLQGTGSRSGRMSNFSKSVHCKVVT